MDIKVQMASDWGHLYKIVSKR